jgi:hypothetical protein
MEAIAHKKKNPVCDIIIEFTGIDPFSCEKYIRDDVRVEGQYRQMTIPPKVFGRESMWR